MKKSKKVIGSIKVIAKEMALVACLMVFVSGLGSAFKLAMELIHAPHIYSLTTAEAYGQFAKDKAGSIAMVTRRMGNRTGGGSAFVTVAASGRPVLITNAHVCEIGKSDMSMDVTFDDGSRTIPARILEIVPEVDLCVLEAPVGHEPLPIGAPAKEHDPIMVMGHPKLLPLTLEAGHLVKPHGSIELFTEAGEQECNRIGGKYGPVPFAWFTIVTCRVAYDADFISVSIFPGNSGSVVINTRGEVVGVVFASQNNQSMGYMVDVEHLTRVLLAY